MIWVSCREIVDNHEKENALNVVTEERTYQIYAESPEDARYTAHLLSLVADGKNSHLRLLILLLSPSPRPRPAVGSVC